MIAGGNGGGGGIEEESSCACWRMYILHCLGPLLYQLPTSNYISVRLPPEIVQKRDRELGTNLVREMPHWVRGVPRSGTESPSWYCTQPESALVKMNADSEGGRVGFVNCVVHPRL